MMIEIGCGGTPDGIRSDWNDCRCGMLGVSGQDVVYDVSVDVGEAKLSAL